MTKTFHIQDKFVLQSSRLRRILIKTLADLVREPDKANGLLKPGSRLYIPPSQRPKGRYDDQGFFLVRDAELGYLLLPEGRGKIRICYSNNGVSRFREMEF